MAFALTGFFARSLEIQNPSKKRGVQQVVMHATGTSADVSLDIGNAGGTFWTAALADPVYGPLATQALAVLQTIAGEATNIAAQSPSLLGRVNVQTLTANGQYTLSNGAIGPTITLHAGDGDTSYLIVLNYEMNDFVFPVSSTLGT